MSDKFRAYGATQAGKKLCAIDFDPGPLRLVQIEIKVTHCGICHSNLPIMDNELCRQGTVSHRA